MFVWVAFSSGYWFGYSFKMRGLEFESLLFSLFFCDIALTKLTPKTQVLRLGGKQVFFSKFLSHDKERVQFVSFTYALWFPVSPPIKKNIIGQIFDASHFTTKGTDHYCAPERMRWRAFFLRILAQRDGDHLSCTDKTDKIGHHRSNNYISPMTSNRSLKINRDLFHSTRQTVLSKTVRNSLWFLRHWMSGLRLRRTSRGSRWWRGLCGSHVLGEGFIPLCVSLIKRDFNQYLMFHCGDV